MRAVLYAYENDGFQSPNLKLSGNDIYVCQPLPCEPAKDSVEPKIVNPPIVKITDPKSPPIKSPVDDNQEVKKKITTVITTTKEDRNSKPKILSGYRLIAKLGTFGSGPGQFDSPAAISGDENGQRFYVADLDNNRIEVIYKGGNYITEWGNLEQGKDNLMGLLVLRWTTIINSSLCPILKIIELKNLILKENILASGVSSERQMVNLTIRMT